MIDYVIRDCGNGEWLPIITVNGTTRNSRFDHGEELYRGERVRDPVQALNRALMIWAGNGTGNIVEFKRQHRIDS